MRVIEANGVLHHVREDGPADGAPVMFSNSLGTDLRLWDKVIPLLPDGLRLIRYDTRGHGLSQLPDGPYSMEDLGADAAAVIEALGCGPVLFVGLSIGGMIAQQLAASRPDLVHAMVLSNTAAKIGTPEMWRDRIETLRRDGLESMADGILERWFANDFRQTQEAALWRAMLARTPADGYAGCGAAIADADLTDRTAGLSLPVLALTGREDGSTPPDLVSATAGLIDGAAFHVIEGAGHLPCVERPEAYAALISPFLKEHARV